MNQAKVLNFFGLLLIMFGMSFVIPLLVAVFYGESLVMVFGLGMSILILLGFLSWFLTKDDKRKQTQLKLDSLLNKANLIAKKIAELYRSGKTSKASILKSESSSIKKQTKLLQIQYSQLEQDIKDILIEIPNIPHQSVPEGNNDKDNLIIKESSFKLNLCKDAKPHWELLEKHNLVNFELGNKLTGSGFPVYVDRGAKLQRALISYFIDKNINAGYTEYLPPHLVNQDSGFGTGQLPKFEDDLYKISGEKDLYP